MGAPKLREVNADQTTQETSARAGGETKDILQLRALVHHRTGPTAPNHHRRIEWALPVMSVRCGTSIKYHYRGHRAALPVLYFVVCYKRCFSIHRWTHRKACRKSERIETDVVHRYHPVHASVPNKALSKPRSLSASLR